MNKFDFVALVVGSLCQQLIKQRMNLVYKRVRLGNLFKNDRRGAPAVVKNG